MSSEYDFGEGWGVVGFMDKYGKLEHLYYNINTCIKYIVLNSCVILKKSEESC